MLACLVEYWSAILGYWVNSADYPTLLLMEMIWSLHKQHNHWLLWLLCCGRCACKPGCVEYWLYNLCKGSRNITNCTYTYKNIVKQNRCRMKFISCLFLAFYISMWLRIWKAHLYIYYQNVSGRSARWTGSMLWTQTVFCHCTVWLGVGNSRAWCVSFDVFVGDHWSSRSPLCFASFPFHSSRDWVVCWCCCAGWVL